MNKFAKVICMIAVVALAFTSCKKNDAKSFKLNATTEQFTEIYDEDFGEKAYLNSSNRMFFEVNDRIDVFNLGTSKKLHNVYECTGFDGAGDVIWDEYTTAPDGFGTLDSDGAYYAFYPQQCVYSYDLNNYMATFEVKDEQVYREDADNNVMVPLNALYMAAKHIPTTGNLDDAWFEFNNICGILSLRFYSPSGKHVTSIVVKDNRFNIVGKITCKLNMIEPNVLTTKLRQYKDTESYNTELYTYLRETLGYNNTDGGKELTLNCTQNFGAAGVELPKIQSKAKRFLIVMRPLALLKGCVITVNFSDAEPAEMKVNRDNRISPSVIRNMPVYNVG